MNKFHELRIDRSFGDIINLYFDFFRQNIKNFTNLFLRYNGIFVILILILSYALVTGFAGMIEGDDFDNLFGSNSQYDFLSVVGLSIVLFFIVMMILAIVNYSLATSYMTTYVSEKQIEVDSSLVWSRIKANLGKIFLFLLLLIPIYIGMMIISAIFAFIPIIGLIPQYIVQFFTTGWVGISFFALLQNKGGVMDAFSEGWKLATSDFWKVVGVNFIIGLLVFILIMAFNIIPGILVGLYTWHIVASETVIQSSIIAKIIYTLGLSFMFLTLIYSQCLSQFVNGVLYYGLHEKQYQQFAQEQIDKIGNSDA